LRGRDRRAPLKAMGRQTPMPVAADARGVAGSGWARMCAQNPNIEISPATMGAQQRKKNDCRCKPFTYSLANILRKNPAALFRILSVRPSSMTVLQRDRAAVAE